MTSHPSYSALFLFLPAYIALTSGAVLYAQNPCEVFREDFNGSTTFREIPLPYGTTATSCLGANGSYFQNNGTEHYVTVYAYFETDLRKSGLNLPSADYVITLKWRTGTENFENSGNCGRTNFDDQFGASCSTPNRLVVINHQLVFEDPGMLNNKKRITVMNYSGPIDSVQLLVEGSCDLDPYITYFDYFTIARAEVLPHTNFGYTINQTTVSFSDSTLNASGDTSLWDFGDGTTSTELNPVHTYATANEIYKVCLTRKNSCGQDSVCKMIDLTQSNPTDVATYPFLASVYVYPNPARENLFIMTFQENFNLHSIKIYNALGKVMYSTDQMESSLVKIDLSNLKPGLHFVRVEGESSSITKKILIVE